VSAADKIKFDGEMYEAELHLRALQLLVDAYGTPEQEPVEKLSKDLEEAVRPHTAIAQQVAATVYRTTKRTRWLVRFSAALYVALRLLVLFLAAAAGFSVSSLGDERDLLADAAIALAVFAILDQGIVETWVDPWLRNLRR